MDNREMRNENEKHGNGEVKKENTENNEWRIKEVKIEDEGGKKEDEREKQIRRLKGKTKILINEDESKKGKGKSRK